MTNNCHDLQKIISGFMYTKIHEISDLLPQANTLQKLYHKRVSFQLVLQLMKDDQ